jgi:hypothetical protein
MDRLPIYVCMRTSEPRCYETSKKGKCKLCHHQVWIEPDTYESLVELDGKYDLVCNICVPLDGLVLTPGTRKQIEEAIKNNQIH